jgi:hypothetical protein
MIKHVIPKNVIFRVQRVPDLVDAIVFGKLQIALVVKSIGFPEKADLVSAGQEVLIFVIFFGSMRAKNGRCRFRVKVV